MKRSMSDYVTRTNTSDPTDQPVKTFSLKFSELLKGLEVSGTTDLLAMTICQPQENEFPNISCIKRTCKACGIGPLSHALTENMLDGSKMNRPKDDKLIMKRESVTWQEWANVPHPNDPKKSVMDKVTRRGTPLQLIDSLLIEVRTFFHRFQLLISQFY